MEKHMVQEFSLVWSPSLALIPLIEPAIKSIGGEFKSKLQKQRHLHKN
jgi:hypothetical protein